MSVVFVDVVTVTLIVVEWVVDPLLPFTVRV